MARPGRGGGGTPGSLFAIDIASREITQVTTQPIGTPDGLESDGRGGYIVADVGGGRIFHVSASGEARQIRQLDRQPADISFIPSRSLLVVPHLGLNRVSAYDLSDLEVASGFSRTAPPLSSSQASEPNLAAVAREPLLERLQ